ncbi:MAG: hypothetical protein ACRC2T_05350, partial [Thermoguttaceae bacterium]
MKINLTPGAYRVLSQADEFFPRERYGISAASVLLALFEETECRAFHWLTEAGLSVDKLRTKLGLITNVELPANIDAEQILSENQNSEAFVTEPVAAPNVNFDTTDSGISGSEIAKADFSAPKLSMTPGYTGPINLNTFNRTIRKKPETSSISWFLNEEPVKFAKVQPEFETAVFSVLNRVKKSSDLLDTS